MFESIRRTDLAKLALTMLRNGMGAPLLVVLVLSMMILPISPLGLDLLFTFNIALSMIVLLVTVYALRPLEFSSFPTVLLVATMLRLALNIASTRVVLLEGHQGTASAGNVIESFGQFVIGGNYAVGLVVFAILVIINFVVVTKGAGRVSEVTALFTLDAMPGKQMAIDADLNSGLIDQDEARTRRADVAREADFYGSMDGASKFVRGDAIAGLLILFINLIGGFAIGMGQHGLSAGEAAHNYALLTIGDGLVAQIPSLLLSMGTAVIVTRVSSSEDMGAQIVQQMFGDRRALLISAAVVGLLGLVPGMPNLVFLGVAGVLAFYGWRLAQRAEQGRAEDSEANSAAEDETQNELGWSDVKPVDIISLEVGYRLVPLVDVNQGGKLLDKIKGVRRKLSEEFGFLVHPVHVHDSLALQPGSYRISLLGVAEGEGDVWPDREMAINPGTVFGEIRGIAARDPAFGMEAYWIEPASRDQAQALGYTVVDCGTVIATHMSKVLKEHAGDLLGHEETQRLLDNLARNNPKLVEELVPKSLSLATVVRVLQNLLLDGVPVKDMRTIAETLVEHAARSTDAGELTSAVRVALKRQITHQINGANAEMPAITLDPELEHILLKSLQSEPGGGLGIEPGLAEKLYQSLAESAARLESSGNPAVLLTRPKLRPWLAELMRQTVPALKVLAYNEIADKQQVRVIANIGNPGMTVQPDTAASASPEAA